jgi:hypothetical protein
VNLSHSLCAHFFFSLFFRLGTMLTLHGLASDRHHLTSAIWVTVITGMQQHIHPWWWHNSAEFHKWCPVTNLQFLGEHSY